MRDITVAEELILLLLNGETGFVTPIPEWRLSCALVGAILLDLSFKGRIDADLEKLYVLDPTPTGDELLDPTLASIAKNAVSHSVQYWIERMALQGGDINEVVFDHLVRRGILVHDPAGFWSLARDVDRSGRYLAAIGRPVEAVRSRVMRVLFENEIPDPHDAAIIGLVRACDGFKAILDYEEHEQVENRIEVIGAMDLFGQSVLAVVGRSYSPPTAARAGMRPLAAVGLWECLMSPQFRSGNLPKFFAEKAQQHGPAYALRLPSKQFVVLAGDEANHWVSRKGRLHLRARDYIEDFLAGWGASRSMASMDGAEHFRMRKAARAGNARAVVEDRFAELLAIGRASFRQWAKGGVLSGERTCQRWTGRQIGQLSTSIELSDELIDGLLAYEFRSLLVHVMGLLPKIALRTPAMRRALQAVLDTYAEIHESHSPAQRAGKRRDLVDDMMDLHWSDPQFVCETDLEFELIAPLIAGHYVGSAMSFALYELMTHPDLFERIAQEADALFADGDPAGKDLGIEAIDVTHRFVMESLRLHPVIPVHNRTAANSFEVGGSFVPAGSKVLLAFPAAHYMAENFEDPDTFDIDRFAPPRNEHRKRGAYQPFGVGTHTCLGSRFTELMMVGNLLLLAHHLELEMVPADYRLKLSPLPKFSPDKKFKFRVKRMRHPIPD